MTYHDSSMHDDLNADHCAYLIRRAKDLYERRGYVPHALAEQLEVYGYTKTSLELMFSLGAQA